MSVSLEFVPEIPDRDAFSALMRAYYGPILKVFEAAGGPVLDVEDMVADTLAHLDEMLPPEGRTLLATDPDGRLVGCGVIRRIRPDAAEFKRMFVLPEMRGTGLGKQIFEKRIAEARRMGCRSIFADTAKGNRPMLRIYEKYGFRYVPRYPENANPPEFEPYLVYLRYDVPDGENAPAG